MNTSQALLTSNRRLLLQKLEVLLVSGDVLALPNGVQLRWVDEGEAISAGEETVVSQESAVFKCYTATLSDKSQKPVWLSVGGMKTFSSMARESFAGHVDREIDDWYDGLLIRRSVSHERKRLGSFNGVAS